MVKRRREGSTDQNNAGQEAKQGNLGTEHANSCGRRSKKAECGDCASRVRHEQVLQCAL